MRPRALKFNLHAAIARQTYRRSFAGVPGTNLFQIGNNQFRPEFSARAADVGALSRRSR